ncbi:uncharacterized protein [Maniola hyperantus]|uniref:uncharacterized protein isoform X1 n=1 Tax=Aphantopus hyperantus TaxID=2795564 RepID=UPI00156A3709|nr:uncharacterized protein LOC117995833 [Maniola hyperantus]
MGTEQNINEELASKPSNDLSATDPPDQSVTTSQDIDQAENARTEQSGPIHERCVHGEINEICTPLDRSEIYFRITRPYDMQPLSKYYLHEWSEAEHLFMSAIEFAEEIYSDWSPCPSPSPTSIGL